MITFVCKFPCFVAFFCELHACHSLFSKIFLLQVLAPHELEWGRGTRTVVKLSRGTVTQAQSSRQNTVLEFFLELFCMFDHDGTISSQDAAFSASCASGSCAFSLHLFCRYLAANGYAIIAWLLTQALPGQFCWKRCLWKRLCSGSGWCGKQCVHILLPRVMPAIIACFSWLRFAREFSSVCLLSWHRCMWALPGAMTWNGRVGFYCFWVGQTASSQPE